MIRGTIILLAVLLGAAVPAFPDIVIHTKDGRAIRVPVEANQIASIEFVSGQVSQPNTPSEGALWETLSSGQTLSGEAWSSGGGNWKFQLRITSYHPSTGAIVGEITWPSLNSINRIRGNLAGSSLTFTETEAIQPGGAHLNVSYTFNLSQNSATGTWVEQGNRDHGGAKFAAP
ncbi:MAG: hypothetical protein ABSA59_05535 [Terriglobia bacterium]|jgi:hypothetical protein